MGARGFMKIFQEINIEFFCRYLLHRYEYVLYTESFCPFLYRPAASYEHREAFIIDSFSLPLPDQTIRETYGDLSKSASKLGSNLLRSLALGFGLEKDFFYAKHPRLHPENGLTGIRSNYYPAIVGEKDVPPGTVRCGEHFDFGTLTLVVQVYLSARRASRKDKGEGGHIDNNQN